MTPRSRSTRRALAALAVAGSLIAVSLPLSSHAASAPSRAHGPTLASLRIPGEKSFVAVARDVVALRFLVDPSMAANAGLFDDAAEVPSFAPDTVTARIARVERDLAALRAMPWRSWPIDRQVDWRWVVANAEDVRLQLAEERLFTHRPAAWLEPLANTYIALATYAPDRADIRGVLARGIPRMVEEMKRVATQPTSRDVTTAHGVTAGVLASLRLDPPGAVRDAAIAALMGYDTGLQALANLPEFAVIGRERYEERVHRVLLLPWNGDQLLAVATAELAVTDSAIAAIKPKLDPKGEVAGAPVPTDEQRAMARTLDQKQLLALYDEVARSERAFLDRSHLVTIPSRVGPIHARPTPQAMVPLTGDGGSMNPPPPFVSSNVGWWNVEHMDTSWTLDRRAYQIAMAQGWQRSWMGPYAAHEGVPGHHLQLSIARLNPNPLRTVLQDNGLTEGWAMYAEEFFWRAGGLGDSPQAENRKLNSWRGRIRRVFYDVNVERGTWTLQEAADFKRSTRPGESKPDEDIMRAIHWPAQLICYFAGKTQLLALERDYRAKVGAAYDARKFRDAVLAEGCVPVALIRAKLLGEPIPEP